MCHECAQELRKQTSKCPICRNQVRPPRACAATAAAGALLASHEPVDALPGRLESPKPHWLPACLPAAADTSLWSPPTPCLSQVESLLHIKMHKGPKPAPQQALTERQVADARAANAAVELVGPAAPGRPSATQ